MTYAPLSNTELGPDGNAKTLTHGAEAVGKSPKARENIKTWFDPLDLDDYVTFGGKP